MKITYVEKEKSYPAFGLAIEDKEKIFIRKDLPEVVQGFLLEHEKFHVLDYKRLKKLKKDESTFWAEVKANAYGFVKRPLGFFLTLIMSLSSARVSMYFNPKKYNKVKRKLVRELK